MVSNERLTPHEAFRIVLGVDDTELNRVQVFPRMPYGWNEMTVNKYPVLNKRQGKLNAAHLQYRLTRSAGGINLVIGSDA